MRLGSEPILPTNDLDRDRAFYLTLGFTAGFNTGDYEIVRRGELVVHLEKRQTVVPANNDTSCYWRVASADELYREFAALRIPVDGSPRLTELQNEPWGMREFTLKDPSGNLIRIGHELATRVAPSDGGA